MTPLRILMVTAEYAPRAKAGGLADMVAGLSNALVRQGHDVRVLLPAYGGNVADLPAVGGLHTSPVRLGGAHPPFAFRQAPGIGPQLYLLDCPAAFGENAIYGGGEQEALRFALLAHGAGILCASLGFRPQVLHCHDWHTALAIPLLASGLGSWIGQDRSGHSRPRSVLTIHNIGYQGVFPGTLVEDLGAAALPPGAGLLTPGEDSLNLLRAGITGADALTTVSPSHAREILTAEYGHGLEDLLNKRADRLTGILNGADYRDWDPATDPRLPAAYSAADLAGKARCRSALRQRWGLEERPVPLAGMVTRLAAQKGLHLVLEVLPEFLARGQLQLVVLGTGDAGISASLAALAARFPGDCAFLDCHDETAARQVYGGSDAFLVPSVYEPCGLTQMYALRYGAVPVVRMTGGLRDTVSHFDPVTGTGNGSVFRDADPGGLRWGLDELLRWHGSPAHWDRLVANGMACDFSWEHQAPLYGELYQRLARA